MSKIGSEKMKAAIHEMLTTNHKERKFKETIDLQIGLKDYDINKDKRFQGDHTLVPRGRVFEFKDKGFIVFTGDWIDDYPQVKHYILDEFNLPEDTKFEKDIHNV